MSALGQDLRYALRTFAKTRGSTSVAIAVLALGIGAIAAIFSVTDAFLLRSLPYKDAGNLVFVWENQLTKNMRQQMVSPADLKDFLEREQSLDEMGAIRSRSSVLVTGEAPERVEIAAVSPAVFEMLGMRPVLGRPFAADEDQPGRNHVVVLSAGLWERRFAGTRNILGNTLSLDGNSYTVIGAAPAGFRVPETSAELWIPYTPAPEELLPNRRGDRFLKVLAHLRAGIPLARAQSELRIIADRLAREYPDQNGGRSVDLTPLRDQMVGDVRSTLWMLMVAVTAILLIACVNVAHLLLARAAAREREMAVRTALGANPARLVRQLLTESILLGVIAGAFGLLLAYWGAWLLLKAAPAGLMQGVPTELSLDWRVLAFTLAVSILTGVAFGLAPALSSARSNLNLVLRSGGRGGTGARSRTRLRDGLMVCEVACSAALLIGAGLLIRSLVRLQQVNPGFEIEHVLTMQLSLPPARYSELKVGLFYEQLLDRIGRLAGVQSAGICRFLPLGGNDASLNFQIEGQPRLADADQPRAKYRAASGGYFTALGIPLRRGRLFDGRDNQRTPKVVIINEAAARRYWPGADPIGKRILSGLDSPPPGGGFVSISDDKWSTIIGVVGDVKHAGLDQDTSPETYYHYLQIAPEAMNLAEGTMSLALRTNADPYSTTSSVRAELRTLDPGLPVYNVHSMQDLLNGSVAQPRFRTWLISAFAALALLLAALGLYGVVAQSVSQRIPELGVRVALGAEPAAILKLVLFQAGGLAAIGLAIGIVASLLGRRIISQFLFGIQPTDPVTLVVVCLVVLLVAMSASLGPALRAARVDPSITLHAE